MPALAILAAAGLCIASVHDGDTVRLCDGERVRLLGIDAPEVAGSPGCSTSRRARSWCDFALGKRSRDALAAFLASGPVTIDRRGTDCYGRTLAWLYVDGRNASWRLVARSLARKRTYHSCG